MVKLDKYKKARIYFFGNEEEKQTFFREFVGPYFRRRIPGRYFINRDWNGGPNFEIVYSSNLIDPLEVQEEAAAFCIRKGYNWTQEQIENNLSSYRKNQLDLLRMERKKMIQIDPKNHLKVTLEPLDMDYYRSCYNSSEHVKLHFQSRFLLQPHIEATLKKIKYKNELLILVIHLYKMTMNLYQYGEKYASVMYYSNIAGVFAIAKQYQVDHDLKENYVKLYESLGIDQLEKLDVDDHLMERYKNTWKMIYDKSVKLYQKGGFEEEGYLGLDEQGARMKSNVSVINSEFHDAFTSHESLDQIITGETHLVFRSIANLLYNILPTLNINFLDKNFCCYAVTEYIFKKYNTSWKEIFMERRIG